MKAKSRKRLLVSSVAMLLVAMLALGTATFAWFTSNPNATAEGLKMKASASKGLVIQTATHKAANADSDFWGHDDYLNYDKNTQISSTKAFAVNPVSFDVENDAPQGFKVEAANDNNYVAADNATVEVAAAGTDYYSEDILCKMTGQTDENAKGTLSVKSLDVATVDGVSQTAGIRVALYYNNNYVGTYAPSARSNKNLTQIGAYSTALSANKHTYETFTDASSVVLGEIGQNGKDKVTVVVYLDGEDESVYSQSISAANLISSVTLNLTVA